MKVTWDAQVLGSAPGARAVDAQNGAQLPLADGAIGVDLPGPYGVRLVKVP